MKQWIFIIFIFPLSVFCYGQGYLDSLPIINKGEILVLGEYHFLQEMQDVEHDIILNYSKTSQDLVVFLELPYQLNFYVKNLFEQGDSILLKTYFKHFSSVKTRIYGYNLILSLYRMYIETPTLQVYCIDRNSCESSTLYTIRELLNTYPNCPESIQKMKHYQKECRHIVIVGNTHANKEKIQFGKISYNPKTKPLAWQLNNINKSPFRHKVYTIHLTPQNIIFPETIINDSLTIASKEVTWITPGIPNHIRKELEAQKKDVAIKMINPSEYPDIHRQYDGFILIKKAHSSIPGNKETIESNW